MTAGPLDPNLVDAVSVLNDAGVRFWLNEGTLLGLIRDGNLIEWDDDIDISVFAPDNALPSIAAACASAGFAVSVNRLRRPEQQGLKLSRPGGRDVDVSEYHLDNISGVDHWTRQWFSTDRSPPTAIRQRVKYLALRIINRVRLGLLWSREGRRRQKHGLVVAIETLHDRLGSRWGFDERFGYFIPAPLLADLRHITVGGVSCPVPAQPESVLFHLYGEGWAVPTLSQHWTDYFVSQPRDIGEGGG